MSVEKTKKRRRGGPRALAAVLPKVAEPALRKRGFSSVEIIANWTEIVGATLAISSAPEKLSFPRGARNRGTLHIRASSSVALEIQHLEPVIIDRINTYFGYGAVERIALIQAPVVRLAEEAEPVAEPATLDPDRLKQIESSTGTIGPEALRHALQQLGQAVGTAQIGPKKRSRS